jgi:hypothetical protein
MYLKWLDQEEDKDLKEFVNLLMVDQQQYLLLMMEDICRMYG